MDIRSKARQILNCSQSLVIYRDLRNLEIWRTMEQLMKGIIDVRVSPAQWMESYHKLLHLLFCDMPAVKDANLFWSEWVLDKVLHSENVFSLQCEQQKDDVGAEISRAVEHDLDCVREIANIPWMDIVSSIAGSEEIYNIFKPLGFESPAAWDDIVKQKGLEGWDTSSLASYYKRYGTGIFSRYLGLYWNGSTLEGIDKVDPITLDQLVGYDMQKQILIENTEKFVKGYPANNVLLYGDKGTGKSSMVKALIHKFGDEGLRIIELPKIYMEDYYKVMNKIEDRGFKFILFIDDLSFEEHETEYKHVKALLEGGLKVKPSNVLVYATSNRRHLIRQMASDRSSVGYHYNDEGDISPTDSMQEKLSLSDRFGITLTFIAPNQKGYLEMVQAIARSRGLKIDDEELKERALQWEKRFNGRSGRTARQFIDDLEGRSL